MLFFASLAVLCLTAAAQPRLKLEENEELGPVVIARDGSLQRVGNWRELSPQEQAVAWKQVARRNEQRRHMLLRESTGLPPPPPKRLGFWRKLGSALRRLLWPPLWKRPPGNAAAAAPEGSSSGDVAPPVALPSREDAAAAAATARAQNAAERCQLLPADAPTLDFAPQFVDLILTERKRATTRWLASEPWLVSLSEGVEVRATCERCEGSSASSGGFAILRISRVEKRMFSELDASVSTPGGFESAEAYRDALLGFYPALGRVGPAAVLHIFHFRLG